MGIFSFFNKQTPLQVEVTQGLMQSFSTPYGVVGQGDLSKPYIRATSTAEPFIRFGSDNLYPQLINQLYLTPLNGGIINYKMNAAIGGGYVLDNVDHSSQGRINELTFLRANKFDKMLDEITYDIIAHGRVCLIVKPTGNNIIFERVGPEKVRTNAAKTRFTVSEDWSRGNMGVTYGRWEEGSKAVGMLYFEVNNLAGMDIYPIPSYCSALNWAYFNGEESTFHKANIQNSVFPSTIIKFNKKIQSEAEKQQVQNVIDQMKGAKNGGKVVAFTNDVASELPTLESFQASNNDKLFLQTSERMDLEICVAHQIDPILMGIRVAGKLGSSQEIALQYQIFEKNVVMPLRRKIEGLVNEMLGIVSIPATFKLNNFQIVDEKLIQLGSNTNTNVDQKTIL